MHTVEEHTMWTHHASKQKSPTKDLDQVVRLPFPHKLKKKNDEEQFKCFLDVLKQLHINILLVETFEQMSNYVKFLKDIFLEKRRLGEFETVALT